MFPVIRPPPRLCHRTFISAPLPGRLEDHSVLLGAFLLRHRVEQKAAISDELGAGRETGLVGGDEQHQARDLFRLGDARIADNPTPAPAIVAAIVAAIAAASGA